MIKHSFSTLGCPYWSFEKSVRYAKELGYDAMAVRFLDGKRYLPDFEAFAPENIEASRKLLEETGITLAGLNGSCCFHSEDACKNAYKEGEASILVAEQLGTPYLRICGDFVNAEWGEEKSYDFIAEGMKPLLDFGAKHGVMPLLETHGDFSRIDRMMALLSRLEGYHLGVVWHMGHTHDIPETYALLKPWLRDMHIVDYTLNEAGEHQYCPTGQGMLPIRQLLDPLRADGYDGYLTLEWEKYWMPSIAEPEVAFPIHIQFVRS